jgi:hypothetical protein
MAKRQIIQQGDVLAEIVMELPKGAVEMPPDKRGVVLAEGEATGHHHRIADTDAATLFEVEEDVPVEMSARQRGFQRKEKMKVKYLKVHRPAELVHEEHKPQMLQPGIYKVSQVREVDPFSMENPDEKARVRYVAD